MKLPICQVCDHHTFNWLKIYKSFLVSKVQCCKCGTKYKVIVKAWGTFAVIFFPIVFGNILGNAFGYSFYTLLGGLSMLGVISLFLPFSVTLIRLINYSE